MYRRVGKRLLDILIAICAGMLLLPVLLLVIVTIKLTDPGPVIYKQKRIGRRKMEFTLLKFRSMPVATEETTSEAISQVRLSPIGRFIRRTNLDEVPQLINVLRGEMSIVGPRPPLPSQVELIEARADNGAIELRPGLTGLAQINSFNGMSAQQKAHWDGIYATKISLAEDILILLGTIGYLLKPPPVY